MHIAYIETQKQLGQAIVQRSTNTSDNDHWRIPAKNKKTTGLEIKELEN